MGDGEHFIPSLDRIAGQNGSDSYAAGTYKLSDDTLNAPIAALVPDAELTPSDFKWLSDKDAPDSPETPDPVLKALTDKVGAGQFWIFEHLVAEITIDVRCIFYY